ncbi:Pol polyprotein [Caligus rogercresseyi]|uniref:Pol polyprotein n=1 Tax=Caligus rogercresseyi TaxID=217165 RepID=A0A7T8HJS4_CALRO|nr:Pol polyprotein [Caligus rogercresseyi]
MDELPWVMLALRATHKDDLDATPAELLYGENLRLPGFPPSSVDAARLDNATVGFASQLRDQVAKLQPKQPATHAGGIKETNSYIPTALKNATHVYVRLDRVRRPLERPYEGPIPVVKLSPSTVTISRRGCQDTIAL